MLQIQPNPFSVTWLEITENSWGGSAMNNQKKRNSFKKNVLNKSANAIAVLALGSIQFMGSSAFAVNGLMKTHFGNAISQTEQTGSTSTGDNNPSGTPKVQYYGGPVIPNVLIHAVYWGNAIPSNIKDNAPDFYATITQSSFMDIGKEYSTAGIVSTGGQSTNQVIGRGSFGKTVEITPSVTNKSVIDDSDIQAEIEKQINSGALPAPTDNTLYMISFPKGLDITIDDGKGGKATSCQQFCAYHMGFTTKSGKNVFYGVMPDMSSFACAFGCGSGSAFDRFSVAGSHEIMEAVTDGFPTPGDKPSYPQAWNTDDGQEVGDLCQSNTATLTGGKVEYQIQQIWSNRTNACTTQPTYSKQ